MKHNLLRYGNSRSFMKIRLPDSVMLTQMKKSQNVANKRFKIFKIFNWTIIGD